MVRACTTSRIPPERREGEGRPNAHGLTKRVVTLVALTNDPTTLNCNLFGTCWLGYVGIETMRLMDNTY